MNITKLRAPINGSSREERSEKKTKLKSDFIFDQSTIGYFKNISFIYEISKLIFLDLDYAIVR